MKLLLVLIILFVSNSVSAQGMKFQSDSKYEWESTPAVISVTSCSNFKICNGRAIDKNSNDSRVSKIISCKTISNECPDAQSCLEKYSSGENGFNYIEAENKMDASEQAKPRVQRNFNRNSNAPAIR